MEQVKKRKKSMSLQRQKRLYGILFILPAFIFVFAFMFYPIMYSAFMSLQDYNYVTDASPSFVGFENYKNAFQDPTFRVSMKNTFIYSSIYFISVMVISLFLALTLFNVKKFNAFFRTSIFIPIVVPLSLASIVFTWILQENIGLLNYFLGDILGLEQLTRGWLTEGKTAMGSIIGVGLWATIGFVTILFLGGLQSISPDILEAAEVDGATGWKKIFYVILPNLREAYILTGIWAIIQALKVFVEPMVMTHGGPGTSTLVMYQEIYFTAFTRFEMGYASAMAYILGIITLVFSLINFHINRSREDI